MNGLRRQRQMWFIPSTYFDVVRARPTSMKTTSRSIRANDWAGAENSIRIAFEHFQAPHVAQANWLENELPRVSSKTKSNLSLSNCICCAFFSLPTDELREMSWLMSHQGIIFINERLFCTKLARWVPAVEKKSLVGKSPKGSFNVNIAIIFIHKLLRAACELQLMMSIKVSRLKCNLDRFCANSYWHQPVPVTVSRAGATDFKCKFLSLYFFAIKTTFASDCDLACLMSIKNVLPLVALGRSRCSFLCKNYKLLKLQNFPLSSNILCTFFRAPDFVVSLRTHKPQHINKCAFFMRAAPQH